MEDYEDPTPDYEVFERNQLFNDGPEGFDADLEDEAETLYLTEESIMYEMADYNEYLAERDED